MHVNMKKYLLFVAEVLTIIAATNASGGDWRYRGKHGVEKWGDVSETCKVKDKLKSRQSPIFIGSSNLEVSSELKEPILKGYDKVAPKTKFKLTNNGHAIEVQINPVKEGDYAAFDRLQNDRKYVPVGFHFHFGSKGKRGTEHDVQGKKYVMEMHMVHRDAKYDLQSSLKVENGLHVIGVFLEIGKDDNPTLQKIVDKLDDVQKPGKETDLEPFPLADLFPKDKSKYYRYMGSLTTPPCSEVVVWVLFKEPITISLKQLKKFQSMRSNEDNYDMSNNIRPTQEIGKRKVWQTKD